jgi:hypothetical protein
VLYDLQCRNTCVESLPIVSLPFLLKDPGQQVQLEECKSVNPPLGDEYGESYRQVYSVMASLQRGECHLCHQKVKFLQSGEDVVGFCGHKLYKEKVGAFPQHRLATLNQGPAEKQKSANLGQRRAPALIAPR